MARIPKTSPLGFAKQTLSWSFSASNLPVMAVVCSLTPKLKRTSRGPAWVRGWGRTVSRIAGVQIHYTDTVLVALSQRKAQVMTFDHGSTLDVPIGAGLLPDGGVLIVKEGMKKIPFQG